MNDLELIENYAKQAGEIALSYFGKQPKVWLKNGTSPVSEADIAIDNFLQEKLLNERKSYGWLSEENVDSKQRLEKNKLFIVDPIDGTRGFINGENEWCISIGIVENGVAVAGVLYAPALKQMFSAEKNCGTNFASSNEKKICKTDKFSNKLHVSAGQIFFEKMQQSSEIEMVKMKSLPSLAWRLAMLAKGEQDLVIVRKNSQEWDIAAADIILQESGCILCELDGSLIKYNLENTQQKKLFACNLESKQQIKELMDKINE